MRRCLMLVAVVVAAASAAPAYGGIPDGAAGPWADSVVDFNRGTSGPGGFVPGRGDPTAALGPAENPPGPDPAPVPGSWVSIGFGGTLTLGFDNPICNGTGDDLDIEIREITREPYALERVNVFVSEDGVTYVFAGVATRDDSVAMPAGIVVANFVRLVDINTYSLAEYPFDPNADGFDVDGVRALNTSCPTGKLEICKSSANGMYSQTFQFSLNGGSPVQRPRRPLHRADHHPTWPQHDPRAADRAAHGYPVDPGQAEQQAHKSGPGRANRPGEGRERLDSRHRDQGDVHERARRGRHR